MFLSWLRKVSVILIVCKVSFQHMCCCIMAWVLHCREQRYPIGPSILPCWKGKHTRCAIPEQNICTCMFCRPKSRASPAPAAALGFHCALVHVVQSFSCPGAKPSGKHLGRATHPLACKLCTWGKMLRKKKKTLEFPVAASHVA